MQKNIKQNFRYNAKMTYNIMDTSKKRHANKKAINEEK